MMFLNENIPSKIKKENFIQDMILSSS